MRRRLRLEIKQEALNKPSKERNLGQAVHKINEKIKDSQHGYLLSLTLNNDTQVNSQIATLKNTIFVPGVLLEGNETLEGLVNKFEQAFPFLKDEQHVKTYALLSLILQNISGNRTVGIGFDFGSSLVNSILPEGSLLKNSTDVKYHYKIKQVDQNKICLECEIPNPIAVYFGNNVTKTAGASLTGRLAIELDFSNPKEPTHSFKDCFVTISEAAQKQPEKYNLTLRLVGNLPELPKETKEVSNVRKRSSDLRKLPILYEIKPSGMFSTTYYVLRGYDHRGEIVDQKIELNELVREELTFPEKGKSRQVEISVEENPNTYQLAINQQNILLYKPEPSIINSLVDVEILQQKGDIEKIGGVETLGTNIHFEINDQCYKQEIDNNYQDLYSKLQPHIGLTMGTALSAKGVSEVIQNNEKKQGLFSFYEKDQSNSTEFKEICSELFRGRNDWFGLLNISPQQEIKDFSQFVAACFPKATNEIEEKSDYQDFKNFVDGLAKRYQISAEQACYILSTIMQPGGEIASFITGVSFGFDGIISTLLQSLGVDLISTHKDNNFIITVDDNKLSIDFIITSSVVDGNVILENNQSMNAMAMAEYRTKLTFDFNNKPPSYEFTNNSIQFYECNSGFSSVVQQGVKQKGGKNITEKKEHHLDEVVYTIKTANPEEVHQEIEQVENQQKTKKKIIPIKKQSSIEINSPKPVFEYIFSKKSSNSKSCTFFNINEGCSIEISILTKEVEKLNYTDQNKNKIKISAQENAKYYQQIFRSEYIFMKDQNSKDAFTYVDSENGISIKITLSEEEINKIEYKDKNEFIISAEKNSDIYRKYLSQEKKKQKSNLKPFIKPTIMEKPPEMGKRKDIVFNINEQCFNSQIRVYNKSKDEHCPIHVAVTDESSHILDIIEKSQEEGIFDFYKKEIDENKSGEFENFCREVLRSQHIWLAFFEKKEGGSNTNHLVDDFSKFVGLCFPTENSGNQKDEKPTLRAEFVRFVNGIAKQYQITEQQACYLISACTQPGKENFFVNGVLHVWHSYLTNTLTALAEGEFLTCAPEYKIAVERKENKLRITFISTAKILKPVWQNADLGKVVCNATLEIDFSNQEKPTRTFKDVSIKLQDCPEPVVNKVNEVIEKQQDKVINKGENVYEIAGTSVEEINDSIKVEQPKHIVPHKFQKMHGMKEKQSIKLEKKKGRDLFIYVPQDCFNLNSKLIPKEDNKRNNHTPPTHVALMQSSSLLNQNIRDVNQGDFISQLISSKSDVEAGALCSELYRRKEMWIGILASQNLENNIEWPQFVIFTGEEAMEAFSTFIDYCKENKEEGEQKGKEEKTFQNELKNFVTQVAEKFDISDENACYLISVLTQQNPELHTAGIPFNLLIKQSGSFIESLLPDYYIQAKEPDKVNITYDIKEDKFLLIVTAEGQLKDFGNNFEGEKIGTVAAGITIEFDFKNKQHTLKDHYLHLKDCDKGLTTVVTKSIQEQTTEIEKIALTKKQQELPNTDHYVVREATYKEITNAQASQEPQQQKRNNNQPVKKLSFKEKFKAGWQKFKTWVKENPRKFGTICAGVGVFLVGLVLTVATGGMGGVVGVPLKLIGLGMIKSTFVAGLAAGGIAGGTTAVITGGATTINYVAETLKEQEEQRLQQNILAKTAKHEALDELPRIIRNLAEKEEVSLAEKNFFWEENKIENDNSYEERENKEKKDKKIHNKQYKEYQKFLPKEKQTFPIFPVIKSNPNDKKTEPKINNSSMEGWGSNLSIHVGIQPKEQKKQQPLDFKERPNNIASNPNNIFNERNERKIKETKNDTTTFSGMPQLTHNGDGNNEN